MGEVTKCPLCDEEMHIVYFMDYHTCLLFINEDPILFNKPNVKDLKPIALKAKWKGRINDNRKSE